MRPIAFALAVTALLINAATAQTGGPARPPLRPDLAIASHHLVEHPHPYQMSEEVARERLKKSGFASTEALKAAGNSFEATATQNGLRKTLRISRLSGKIEELHQ